MTKKKQPTQKPPLPEAEKVYQPGEEIPGISELGNNGLPEQPEQPEQQGSETQPEPPFSFEQISEEEEEEANFYQEQQQQNTTSDEGSNLGQLVNGEIAVMALDYLGRIAVPFIGGLLGQKINGKDVALTAGEKRIIQPQLEECLKTVNVNISNPWVALTVVCVSIYSFKVIEISKNKPEGQQSKPGRGRPKKF